LFGQLEVVFGTSFAELGASSGCGGRVIAGYGGELGGSCGSRASDLA
jgi:hypothetical protein